MTRRAARLPTDAARSDLMRRVRQRGTKPEGEVASILRELKLRFRCNVRKLPGSPDFANQRRRWAIFVNGCFWHRHDGCVRTTTPTRNRQFWLAKFESNKQRDKDKIELLRAVNFVVLTVWECETGNRPLVRQRLRGLTRLG